MNDMSRLANNADQSDRGANGASPLTLVLDVQAQAALLRSQTARLAWLCATTEYESGRLWDERAAAALHLADVIDRLATVVQVTNEMSQSTSRN
ncbi:hypothetical protein GIW56_25070 [Pseudomonas gessardii]|uniref:Uncharacterized protein n=1 Tax=Pseudomonas gessardii TaxID=78544 RepID=A0ABS9FEZ3_9PSED|nr:hypothetical protein [Pseudomonas gessardii]MCF4992052.1 hypothetical protein [Pseudomonas gessardii]MCF5096896.1 hypothetical protein [Pseudomonas gessardii]MCF5110088.1 hypothetical protein [Pseudomonas gessardii]